MFNFICKYCGKFSKVTHTAKRIFHIYRRFKCLSCGKTFSAREWIKDINHEIEYIERKRK